MSTIDSQSIPTSYTWAFPGSPIQVRLRLAVVNEMQKVWERPAHGTAFGCGLLLGTGSRPGGTEISGFESLSTLDPAVVESAKARAQDSAVGFYRTTEKGALRLTEADLSLARTHFCHPDFVVLLVEIDESGPCNAAFFFWDQGQMYGDLALMEFPFDAGQLAVSEQIRVRAAEARIPAAPTPEPVAPRSWKLPMRGLSIAVVLAVVALVAYSLLTLLRRPAISGDVQAANPPASSRNSLGLSIERKGSDLLLSWDRLSAPIRGASFGEVMIREGDGSRKIRLTQQQLQSGSILYAPTTDQVELELSVVNGEKVTGESMTAVLPPVGPHPLATSTQTFESSRQPNAPVAASAPAVAVASRPPAAAPEPRRDSAASADRELRKFSIPRGPASQRSPATVPITEAPPAVATIAPASALGSPLNWQLPAIPPPPSAPVPATLAHEAALPQPPVATHQVTPRYPSDLKPYMISNTPVEILVHIDAKGKVIRAEPVSKQSANIVLVQAALDAARGWTFRPATVGNTPVASEMVLKFNFTAKR